MATSTSKGFPYPQSSDAVDVPTDIYNLANTIDTKLTTTAVANTIAYRETGGALTVGTPTASTHAATKAYVDGISAGLNAHDNVKVASTVALTGTYTAGSATSDGGTGYGATFVYSATTYPTIDGITLVANDRVLLKDQATATQNGIYSVTTVAANITLTRASDYDNTNAGEVASGDFVFISAGTANINQGYVMNSIGTNTDKSIKIGTDNINWTLFANPNTAQVSNDNATATTVYPLWSPSTSGAATLKTSSTGISFVPSTGTLSLTNLTVTNTISGTSNNASNIAVTADAATATLYPLFANTSATTSSGTSARVVSGITYNASTGILSLTSPAITTSITTPSTTFSIANATATTVNIGGGATTAVNIGNSTAGATVTLASTLKLRANSTGANTMPIQMQSRSVGTAAGTYGGGIEYDGNAIYAFPNSASTLAAGGGRAVVPATYYGVRTTALTLAASTAAQTLTGLGFTAPASTSYEFELYLGLSAAESATSHTLSLSFTGTAGYTSVVYNGQLQSNTTASTVNAPTATYDLWGAAATATLITPAIAAAATYYRTIKIKGFIRTNATPGTVIPTLTWSVAPTAAPSLYAGSYFKLTPIGTDTATSIGIFA